MKKARLFLSVFLLITLLLSACTALGGLQTNNSGANGTPEVNETEASGIPKTGETEVGKTPEVGETEAINTPEVGETETVKTPEANEVEATHTPEVGETEVVKTPESGDNEATHTPEPAETENATPNAAVPAAGAAAMNACGANRLSKVIGMHVVNPAGLEIGKINGVVLNGTQIAFLGAKLNVAGQEDKPVVVPYKSFTLQAGPAGEDCNFVLNLPDTVLAQIPLMDVENLNLAMPNWDQALSSFWAGHGLTVPNSGTQGSPLILNDHFDKMLVSGANNAALGEVDEILLDPQSAMLQYVVMKAEDTLGPGKRYIPIPVARVTWANGAISAANLPLTTLQNAPSFTDSDQYKALPQGWDANIRSYWATVKP